MIQLTSYLHADHLAQQIQTVMTQNQLGSNCPVIVASAQDKQILLDQCQQPFTVLLWSELYRLLAGKKAKTLIESADQWLILQHLFQTQTPDFAKDFSQHTINAFLSEAQDQFNDFFAEGVTSEDLQIIDDPKHQYLAQLFRRYRDFLDRKELITASALQAESLRHLTPPLPFGGLITAGFLSLTHTQFQLLKAVDNHGGKVWLFVPEAGPFPVDDCFLQLDRDHSQQAGKPNLTYQPVGDRRMESEALAGDLLAWEQQGALDNEPWLGWENLGIWAHNSRKEGLIEVMNRLNIPYRIKGGVAVAQTLLWRTLKAMSNCHKRGFLPQELLRLATSPLYQGTVNVKNLSPTANLTQNLLNQLLGEWVDQGPFGQWAAQLTAPTSTLNSQSLTTQAKKMRPTKKENPDLYQSLTQLMNQLQALPPSPSPEQLNQLQPTLTLVKNGFKNAELKKLKSQCTQAFAAFNEKDRIKGMESLIELAVSFAVNLRQRLKDDPNGDFLIYEINQVIETARRKINALKDGTLADLTCDSPATYYQHWAEETNCRPQEELGDAAVVYFGSLPTLAHRPYWCLLGITDDLWPGKQKNSALYSDQDREQLNNYSQSANGHGKLKNGDDLRQHRLAQLRRYSASGTTRSFLYGSTTNEKGEPDSCSPAETLFDPNWACCTQRQPLSLGQVESLPIYNLTQLNHQLRTRPNLKISTDTQPFPLNVSSINNFVTCPAKWAFSYLRIPEMNNETLYSPKTAGTAVHAVFEQLWNQWNTKRDQQLTDLFDQQGEHILIGAYPQLATEPGLRSHKQSLLEKLKSAFQQFDRYVKKAHLQAVACEVAKETTYTVELDDQSTFDFKLIARIDREDQRDGKTVVWDYKTGEIGANLYQAQTYELLYHTPTTAVYYSTKHLAVRYFDKEDKELYQVFDKATFGKNSTATEQLKQLALCLIGKKFEPQHNPNCNFCSYAGLCRVKEI